MRQRPRLFIGSSTESLPIAYAVQEELDHDLEVTVWSQNVFHPTAGYLDTLLNSLDNYEAALFVFSPEDEVNMRGAVLKTVRDNVLFEFGLFLAKLGRERCFFLVPSNAEGFHLPSDLLGINPTKYNPYRQDGNLRAAVGPACNTMRTAIFRAEGRQEVQPSIKESTSLATVTTSTPPSVSPVETTSDGGLSMEQKEAALQRMKTALSGEHLWRSIERLATVAGLSENDALALLRSDSTIVLGKGKSGRSIARLASRKD